MTASNRLRGRPRESGEKAAQNTIQSLDRALEILDLVASGGGLSLSEIANTLDQSPSTVYRVLTTLEARQVVEVDRVSQVWHIGAAAFRLGSSFLRRAGVVERSRPFMRELMETTGETANLGIEKGGTVLFVSQVETFETIRAFFPPGTQSPMHASGIGKALLSQFTGRKLDGILAEPMRKFTDKTITTPESLVENLALIRERGYSFDDEERTIGMRCIAAPVMDLYGEVVAGISISGPSHRLPLDRIESVGADVRRVAQALSQTLGASV